MADSTLSNLPAATDLDGTELFYAVQSASDKKVTQAILKSSIVDRLSIVTFLDHPDFEEAGNTKVRLWTDKGASEADSPTDFTLGYRSSRKSINYVPTLNENNYTEDLSKGEDYHSYLIDQIEYEWFDRSNGYIQTEHNKTTDSVRWFAEATRVGYKIKKVDTGTPGIWTIEGPNALDLPSINYVVITSGSTLIEFYADKQDQLLEIGMLVTGTGIPSGSVIVDFLNGATTGTGTNDHAHFHISAAATSSTTDPTGAALKIHAPAYIVLPPDVDGSAQSDSNPVTGNTKFWVERISDTTFKLRNFSTYAAIDISTGYDTSGTGFGSWLKPLTEKTIKNIQLRFVGPLVGVSPYNTIAYNDPSGVIASAIGPTAETYQLIQGQHPWTSNYKCASQTHWMTLNPTGGLGQKWTDQPSGAISQFWSAGVGWVDEAGDLDCTNSWRLTNRKSGSNKTVLTADDGGRVAIGTAAPDSKAQLDVQSTTRGFLPPRMTSTQRDAISSPTEGLVIYNTTTHKLNVRGAASWEAVTSI